MLNGIVYLTDVFNVGVKSLLNFTVVTLDVMAGSVSSISFRNWECLNALSNCVKLFVLKLLIVEFTFDISVSCVFVVFFEL